MTVIINLIIKKMYLLLWIRKNNDFVVQYLILILFDVL